MISFFAILLYASSAYTQVSQEQARQICAQQMAGFTKAVSGAYQKGMSYAQFQSTLCGTLQPVAEGANQLKAAYNFLVSGTSADNIIRTYPGKEIAASLRYLLNTHKKGFDSDGSELFGGKTGTANASLAKNSEGGCKWYQVWCLMQAFASWVVQNWTALQQIIEAINGPMLGD